MSVTLLDMLSCLPQLKQLILKFRFKEPWSVLAPLTNLESLDIDEVSSQLVYVSVSHLFSPL